MEGITMTSFRNFWWKTKEGTTNLETSLSTPSSSGLSNSIQASVTAISIATAPFFQLTGVNTSLEEAEKFSREVAQCATSDEVISAVSDEICEPKSSETEEEFVERASNIFRRILREKFNV
jgi:hypothetical protein